MDVHASGAVEELLRLPRRIGRRDHEAGGLRARGERDRGGGGRGAPARGRRRARLLHLRDGQEGVPGRGGVVPDAPAGASRRPARVDHAGGRQRRARGRAAGRGRRAGLPPRPRGGPRRRRGPPPAGGRDRRRHRRPDPGEGHRGHLQDGRAGLGRPGLLRAVALDPQASALAVRQPADGVPRGVGRRALPEHHPGRGDPRRVHADRRGDGGQRGDADPHRGHPRAGDRRGLRARRVPRDPQGGERQPRDRRRPRGLHGGHRPAVQGEPLPRPRARDGDGLQHDGRRGGGSHGPAGAAGPARSTRPWRPG